MPKENTPHHTPDSEAPPPAPTPRSAYDSAYKLMFSVRAMVYSLLNLIAPDLVAELDPDTLERFPGERIAKDGRKRFNDIVWKVQRKGRTDAPCYVAILLEFQSTPERFMALRLLTYVALLLEDLAETDEVKASGLLPPVLPIVLYNGSQPWVGVQDVAELFAPMPENLRPLNPKMSYLLLEERKVPEDALQNGGLAAQLIRLEQAGDPRALQAAVSTFLAGLSDESREVLTAALNLLVSAICRRLGFPVSESFDVRKEQTMLAENLERWHADGVAKGEARGEARGRAEGEARGEAKERLSTVRTMLQMGRFALEDIAAATRMSLADVQRLAAQAAQ